MGNDKVINIDKLIKFLNHAKAHYEIENIAVARVIEYIELESKELNLNYNAERDCVLYDECDIKSKQNCLICEHEDKKEKSKIINLMKEAGIMK